MKRPSVAALLLLVATCQLCSGLVEESFNTTAENGSDNEHVIPDLWTQTGQVLSRDGNGTASGKLPQADTSYGSSSFWQRGYNMKLERANPAAETVLLDWDGTTTNLTFGACVHRQECPTTPGNLSLLWCNDSFLWEPLWNYTLPNPLRQWCNWANVTVPVPITAATPRFAFKWVLRDATNMSSTGCSALLLDNITFPVQIPTAANLQYGFAPPAFNATVATCTACKNLCPSVMSVGP
jgi:hypothetical protein